MGSEAIAATAAVSNKGNRLAGSCDMANTRVSLVDVTPVGGLVGSWLEATGAVLYCCTPNRPNSTSYGACFSGCSSKRLRSKYCTVYVLPSVADTSLNCSLRGNPNCCSPPYLFQ